MENKKFYIRSLSPKDLNEMYFAFLDAFEDYPVPFRLNKEQFVRKFVEKLKIDFSLSVGAFDYDTLSGFIFTSVNMYKNKLTAYNGGTGVKKAFRGNRLTDKMYEYLIPKFREKGIRQCVLEVLVNNAPAIKVYEDLGFKKNSILYCFKIEKPMDLKTTKVDHLEIIKIQQPDLSRYEQFQDFQPSFLDSLGMITENLANEEIIEARINGDIIGYAIYQPAFGRLSQIGVRSDLRRSGIGYSMLAYILENSHTSTLTVLNINDKDKVMLDFMKGLGFENQINQYEMLLDIND